MTSTLFGLRKLANEPSVIAVAWPIFSFALFLILSIAVIMPPDSQRSSYLFLHKYIFS